jgi:membrane protein YdbS with pleckstrin-like domain
MGITKKQAKKIVALFTLAVVFLVLAVSFIGCLVTLYYEPSTYHTMITLITFVFTMAIFYVIVDIL